jgi:hypothetical protein
MRGEYLDPNGKDPDELAAQEIARIIRAGGKPHIVNMWLDGAVVGFRVWCNHKPAREFQCAPMRLSPVQAGVLKAMILGAGRVWGNRRDR